MTFVIAHITDTHLSSGKPYFVDNFRAVAAHLRQEAPDLVVNTGDVSLNGADLVDDLEAARALHEELGLPWRVIPGNHDLGDNQETAKKQPANAQRRARWLSVFGEDYWLHDVPGWRLLAINSLLLGSDIAEAADQEAFVREAVEGLGARALLLFLHKPLFIETPDDEALSGHQVNPHPRRRLFEALGAVRPRLVCAGHVHEYHEASHGMLHQVWAPGTSFTIPDWFIPPHGEHTVGYVRVELDPDGSFRTRHILPEGVERHCLSQFPQAYGDINALKPVAA